jgi:hypothetical protein
MQLIDVPTSLPYTLLRLLSRKPTEEIFEFLDRKLSAARRMYLECLKKIKITVLEMAGSVPYTVIDECKYSKIEADEHNIKLRV